ncbi:MAG TPA: PAS domain S-box protein, partial [Humisphaera sp.]
GRVVAWTLKPAGAGRVVCTGVDVTAERHAARSAAEAEDRLNAVVGHSPDFVVFQDTDLRFTWVSRTLPGMSPADVLGRTDADFLHPDELAQSLAVKRRVMATGVAEQIETRLDIAGHRLVVESLTAPRRDAAGRTVGIVVYARDVTERWRAQEALREANETLERRVAERTAELAQSVRAARDSEERHRLLFERSPVSSQIITADGRIVRTNRAWEAMWGVTLPDLPGYDVFAEPQLEANGFVADLRRTLGGETVSVPPTAFHLYRGAHAGDTRWVRTLMYPVASAEDGTIREVVLLQDDVTDQRRAEDALRLRTALLEAVGEAAIDGVLAVSADGRILWSNRRFAELWGLAPDTLAGGSDAEALAAVHPLLADPQSFDARVEFLYRNPHERGRDEVPLRDGRVFDRFTAPITAGGGGGGGTAGRVWFFRDVTDRHRAEAALRASERHHRDLAERNRWLAREVEHRVANHLAGLIGLVAVMRARAADGRTFADAIEARLRAMADVHRLLAAAARDSVNLRDLVRTALGAGLCLAEHRPAEDVCGPDVAVPAERVMPLMMILVEWYTNSCKYGAHSRDGTSLRVSWSVATGTAGRRVRLRWRERGVRVDRAAA